MFDSVSDKEETQNRRRRSVTDTSISIKNCSPEMWVGRAYDVGLYKDDDLIVVKENLRVGNHAEFQLSHELLFAVVEFSLKLGEVFSVKSMLSGLTPVNLQNFVTGVVVTLTKKPGSGEFVFTTEEAEI